MTYKKNTDHKLTFNETKKNVKTKKSEDKS